MKEYETWLKKSRRDSSSFIYPLFFFFYSLYFPNRELVTNPNIMQCISFTSFTMQMIWRSTTMSYGPPHEIEL